ncbi:MAG: biotin transporter BioY [Candidatus Omnitrophota bacterium]|nr:biotin transporter BioY [Candidatus Omnitrophota bacterium]
MKAISCSQKQQLIFEIVLILAFTFLMVLSAYVRIPLFFTPVPITMQTFVVYLSIIFLKNKAFLSQGAYVFFGLVGLPVFTNFGSGFIYLLGPTGGYILGFFAATIIFSRLLPGERTFFKNFFFFFLVASVIYTPGIIWLMLFHKFSFASAVSAGLLPFIGGEIFKISLASIIATKIK